MALRINPRRPHLAAAALLALWLAACAGGPSHPLAQHDAFRQGELANRQARAALARGELSSARQLTEQARQHYQRLDARERVIDCELQLATLALRQNDLAGVRAALARLADWQLTPEQQRALAERHISLALREQQAARAADWLKQARAACAAPCARAATLDVFAARIAAARQDLATARQLAEQALAGARDDSERAAAHRLLAEWTPANAPRTALSHYLAALEFDQREGYSAGLAQDLAGAAAASQALGDARAAREYRQRAEAVNAAMRAAAGR